MSILILAVLVLAAIPACLFLVNLTLYRPLPDAPLPTRMPAEAAVPPVSVLIPARNEEGVIGEAVRSALEQDGVELELIVLDDQSTDRTAEIVRELQREDPRVQLHSAPPLPAGWCGKQHACHALAALARHPIWVFMDADVRLQPRALRRMARFMADREVALASGVPRQITGTFLERLLLPLIHFVLLGYLPMPFMRRSNSPAFAAGCGQLFVANAQAYRACGGHAGIRRSLHDGLTLPRHFRTAGLRTDLFDATDVATCRMYRSGGEVWRGLGKNATEGLAHPARIVPMTLLLFGAQVMPFLLLAAWGGLTGHERLLLATAVVCAWLPRALAAARFRQPWDSALLTPLGVSLLLVIQWIALVRSWSGRPAQWKGRSYGSTGASAAEPPPKSL